MAGKVNEIWIGSEHEVEEAFASPRVTVQQCYAIHRADAYIKSMLQQNGIKAAGVAQLVEQLICNQQVAGSSPIASSFCECLWLASG
jgi:glycyl-tRNA synthetase (class II)